MTTYFLYLSTIFAIISPIIGITSTLKGTFKPQRMTRFLIMVVSFLFVGTLLAQGDKNSIVIAVAQTIGSAIIFFLSLKRGLGGSAKLDFIVLVAAIISLIVWKSTNNPTLGLIMSIATDLIGFTPTLIKAWQLPHSEDWRFYCSDVLASTFSLLSITTPDIKVWIFPIYILFINTLSVAVILFRQHRCSNL
jgi:hypothetical protein